MTIIPRAQPPNITGANRRWRGQFRYAVHVASPVGRVAELGSLIWHRLHTTQQHTPNHENIHQKTDVRADHWSVHLVCSLLD
jgi:hypothetical protein